jgi:hypothetical protein
MFGFFVSGEFKGFWSNKVGDKFADITIQKMGWPKSLVTLVCFNGLLESEVSNCDVTLEKARVYKQGESDKFLLREIAGDKFIVSGLIIKPC